MWMEQVLEAPFVLQPVVVSRQVDMSWSHSLAKASHWDGARLNHQHSSVRVGVDRAVTIGVEGLRSRLLVQPYQCC